MDRSSLIEQLIDSLSRIFFKILKDKAISPNQITFIGILFGLSGCLIFYFKNNIYLNLIAFILLILYLIFDFVDGDLARHKNKISQVGYFLDIFGDKLIMIFMLAVVYLKAFDGNEKINLLNLILLSTPIFFQFNLVIFNTMKSKNENFLKKKEQNNSNFIINIYRSIFFPTHINIVFLLALGLLFKFYLIIFYFVTLNCLLAICRQLYLIFYKLEK